MYSSRVDTEFKTSICPETLLMISKTTNMQSDPIHPSCPLGYLGVRKPIAGEVEDPGISNFQIQIQKGKDFFLEDFINEYQEIKNHPLPPPNFQIIQVGFYQLSYKYWRQK